MSTPLHFRSWRALLAIAVASCMAACTPSEEKVAGMAAQAQQLLDAGQPAQAQALILRALSQRDDLPAVYLVQAHIALAFGRQGDAYQAFANALALEATNPEALLGAAQTGLGSGHVDAADSAADKVLVLEPNQPDALLVKGIIRLVRNDLEASTKFADRILAQRPSDVGALVLKSRALALQGDREGALKLIENGIKSTGPTLEMTMSLAELQRANGNGEAFLAALRRIRELAPKNRTYRFDLADTLYRLGRADEARQEVVSLLDEPITAPDELNRFARLWYAYDHMALAPDQIAHTAAKAPIETRLAAARYFIASGQSPVAAALLKPVATGWSADVQALYARAGVALDRAAEANAVAAQILTRDEENGDALLIRAGATLANGEPAKAIVDYQRVIHNYPTWEEGYLGLAQAYAADRKPVGVRRAFEDARSALPQSLSIAAAYVRALPGLGDKQHALEVARRFALDSPSLIKGWELYGATCRQFDDGNCGAEVSAGLASAHRRFGLDLAPGTPPPVALIGRLN